MKFHILKVQINLSRGLKKLYFLKAHSESNTSVNKTLW